jgi:acyl carrier protein
MGLDTVEHVLRIEEVFGVDLPDWKLEQMRTVGDLYILVCEALNLTPVENPTPETGFRHIPQATNSISPIRWTPEDIWATLLYVISDQLQVNEEEVTFTARIHDDLGCD